MAEILHELFIAANPTRVFDAVSTAGGLEGWWTKRSKGEPAKGSEYVLWFVEQYDWRAIVSEIRLGEAFELEITRADEDWLGTRVGFELSAEKGGTRLSFSHSGWADQGQHFRISSYCWATYLRIMKRYLEHGELVPYDERDSA